MFLRRKNKNVTIQTKHGATRGGIARQPKTDNFPQHSSSEKYNSPIQAMMDEKAFIETAEHYGSGDSFWKIRRLLRRYRQTQESNPGKDPKKLQKWADESMEVLLNLEKKIYDWYSANEIRTSKRLGARRYAFWPVYYLMAELLEQVAEERRSCVEAIINYRLTLWSPVKKKVKPAKVQQIWEDILAKRGNILLTEMPEELQEQFPPKDYWDEFQRHRGITESSSSSSVAILSIHSDDIRPELRSTSSRDPETPEDSSEWLPADQGAISMPIPTEESTETDRLDEVPWEIERSVYNPGKPKGKSNLKTARAIGEIKEKEEKRHDLQRLLGSAEHKKRFPKKSKVSFEPTAHVLPFRQDDHEIASAPVKTEELVSPTLLLKTKFRRMAERRINGGPKFYWDLRADLARMLQQEESAALLSDIANSRRSCPIYIAPNSELTPGAFQKDFIGFDSDRTIDPKFLTGELREYIDFVWTRERSQQIGRLGQTGTFRPEDGDLDLADTVLIGDHYLPEHPMKLFLPTMRIDETMIYAPTQWNSRNESGSLSLYPSYFVLMRALASIDKSRKGLASNNPEEERFLEDFENPTRAELGLYPREAGMLAWEKEMYPTQGDEGDSARRDPS
ncbi:hypothetical protein FUAX_05620 [Fulvitalea axinellae]|uniref:Uncharacterized protein n=1 Tax=Fulvitalea axinellae TaxID=1182444 RepID=A0AAU9D7I1_9BACT|nr:hypothetical protein FUAX_05620 [Fulvitalea axinellae]